MRSLSAATIPVLALLYAAGLFGSRVGSFRDVPLHELFYTLRAEGGGERNSGEEKRREVKM